MGTNADAHRVALEQWNQRDFDARVSTLVENFTYESHPDNRTVKSRAEFKAWVEDWAQAVPDGRITDASFIEGDDATVAICTLQGTNDGPFGTFPPTGRRVALLFCEVMRYDQDGRVTSGEIFFDLFSLLVQLGHVQPPTS
jgi:steroid delta-isomerase-like uncharacterized protein